MVAKSKAVVKVSNEKGSPNPAIMRQFSRTVMTLGNLRNSRKDRFFQRPKSDLAKKRSAIRRIENGIKKRTDYKLGKPVEIRGRRK